jgi:hypothetical protein
MMHMDMSFQAIKKAIEFFFLLLIASSLIFFVTGFIFYKHAKSRPSNHSITMPIERPSAELSSAFEDKEKEEAPREDEQLASVPKELPRLSERLGKLMVATGYKELLAQMQSILVDREPVQASDVIGDRGRNLT